ncbi:MAG: bifunctional diaminohydroxyphosphoribosylaminopyrimidine deaminase/5-amino-6-(5-phosphoribosylamino)uracil reductase RibD [Bacteroidota bacterium]
MNIDQKYMLRAIELGKNALGTAAPNPAVGCCIVYQDSIIGEGYTDPYGGPHAEVNAIQSVKDRSLLEKATLYVTLEPCSHFGKTPPCSDLIIKKKIPKVVIGLKDPHHKVAGKGIEKLKSAGIEVVIGIKEEACRTHHIRFLTFQEKKRPYIILKWAESSDGYIAPDTSKRNANAQPYWITNPYSRQLVHQWRSEEQSVLVGTQTALDDNPRLDVRHWKGRDPVRIILDRTLKIPKTSHLFDGSSKTILLTQQKLESRPKEVIIETINFNQDLPSQICSVLYRHQITSMIIEGGTKTLQSFIDADVWDEARIFTGVATFGSGTKSPVFTGNQGSRSTILEDGLNLFTHD